MNGELLPWKDAKVHVLAHSLHYGGSVFEGIRCYQTNRGPAIFRLKDHIQRFLYSMNTLKMCSKWSVNELCEAVISMLRANQIKEAYIRPLAYFGYGKMGLRPNPEDTNIILAAWPWDKYLSSKSLKMKTSSYMRIHPKSTDITAKISGHYVNSILASQELEGTDYDEALLLDYKGNIAEGPGENIFLIKNEKIFTPKVGTILEGYTRDTVKALAEDRGYEMLECDLKLQDLIEADEAFLTGTAAEISPIASIDEHHIKTSLGEISMQIREDYMNLVHGRSEKYLHWLTFLENENNC